MVPRCYLRWQYLRFFRTSLKDRQVLALGDSNNDGLVLALVGEMMLELHPQHAGLRANDVVVIRVVARPSTVDVNRDLRFRGLFGLVLSSTSAHVEEERPQTRRFFEGDAGGDPAHQFLSLLCSDGRGLLRMHDC